MSYLFELRSTAGIPGYVVANGDSQAEALAHLHQQLGVEDAEELVVLAVHSVH